MNKAASTSPSRKVKVAILGAGTAGLNARRKVAEHTDSYVVIDGGDLGTTCAREGCMPSKDLLHYAHAAHADRELHEELELQNPESLYSSIPKIFEKVRLRRDRFVSSVVESMSDWSKTHLIRKNASLISKHCIDLGDEIIEADHILIATGSRSRFPDEWEKYSSFILTSESFFDVAHLPRRMAVLGSGAIGLEIAQAMARLGVEVSVFSDNLKMGVLENSELQDMALKIFGAEFEIIEHRAEPLRASDTEITLSTPNGPRSFEKVLLAVGRRPNVESLNLDVLGQALAKNGLPEIGEDKVHISGTNVYLIGDVSTQRPVLHEARHAAETAVDMIFSREDKPVAPLPRLNILFTQPQICVVGESFSQMKKKNASIVSYGVSLSKSGRALIEHDGEGAIKVYIDMKSGRVRGAELLCHNAEHLGHLLALAIQRRLTAYELLEMPYYHPTLEESLRNIWSRYVSQHPLQQREYVSSLDFPKA